MNIYLIAYMKKYSDFISHYREGDEKKLYNGKSLIFYSLANNDVESRYAISSFLLDKGIAVNGLNEENENVLHVLLSRKNHNLKQTIELCKRLIDSGANINQIDKKEMVPLQYIINMKYTDEELETLYEIWFAKNHVVIDHKNAWEKTPLEIAEIIPYREKLLERMKKQSKVSYLEQIINEWDPVGLFPMAPKDEYMEEIKKIKEYIQLVPDVTESQLTDKINEIFVASFGKDVYKENRETSTSVAGKIIANL